MFTTHLGKMEFLLIVLLFSVSAWSRWDTRLESYLTGKYFEVKKSTIDPNNQIFERPDGQASVELRPEFKYRSQRSHKLILRPNVNYLYQSVTTDDGNRKLSTNKAKINLTDAFLESIWNDYVRTTVGLQVYQWGSAEFLNASNPFYHLNNQQRSVLFKEKGKALLRMNVDYTRNWNQAFIVEPVSNAETQWIEGTEFVPKGLVKSEWVSDSGVSSVGFVFGTEERNMGFVGEYFNYAPVDGLTLYLDSKHTENSVAYYPDGNPYGTESLYHNSSVRGGWVSFGVAGVRKEWSHLDLRLEYIYNTGGWTETQFKEAKVILTNINPDTYRNIARFARPGLELIGRGYGYLSARIFNLGTKDNHSLSVRYLVSQTDFSSTILGLYEWDVNDYFNLFFEASNVFGKQAGELSLLPQQTFLIGFRWSI